MKCNVNSKSEEGANKSSGQWPMQVRHVLLRLILLYPENYVYAI